MVACSSTTRNTASGDDNADSAGETSTAHSTASGGSGGTGDGPATSFGGSGGNGGATSNSNSAGGSGGSSTDGAAGSSSDGTAGSIGGTGGGDAGGTGGSTGGTGGGSSDSTNATSTTGDGCPDDGLCSSDCPCSTGEGVCSVDDECASGLVCTTAAVAKLGFTGGDRSCMPQHCDNDALDEDLGETSQDCGGDCGCRASYEIIEFEGLPNTTDYVYLLDLSGDGGTLVGGAAENGATPENVPVVISATDGVVNFLENFGVYGWADFVNDDGSIIAGTLSCDDPPDCTDGFGVPFHWSGDDSPIRYPFATAATGMSASGNVVVYTEYGTDPERGYRLLTSTGSATYAPELKYATGVSGNGAVVYGALVDGGNDGVWYTQSDEVWPPPYPGEWSGGASILGMSTDGSVLVGEGRQWIDEANVDYFPFISQDQSFELVDIVDDRIIDVRPAARGMSGDGARFVGSGYNQDTSTREAVFWDEAGGLRTLYDELVARGFEFPVDVTEIGPEVFISTNGRILVGSGGSNLRPFWRIVLDD